MMQQSTKRGRMRAAAAVSILPANSLPDVVRDDNPLAIDELCSRHAVVIERGIQEELSATLAEFSSYLRWLRKQSDEQEWLDAERRILGHRLADLMLLDPLTHHARQTGHLIVSDPELLDLIYGGGRSNKRIQSACPVGRKIFAYMHGARRSKAIRQQRAMIAESLVSTLCGRDSVRIAAVGCGYLRELYSIAWNKSLPVDLFLAIDKDWRISAAMRRQDFHSRLKTASATPWEVAHFGLVHLGIVQQGFDLVYSLGVLDQVDDIVAEKLIKRLADHLAPRGQLHLSNSVPDTPDAVFQNVLLGQKNRARTLGELERIASAVSKLPGFQVSIKEDSFGEFCNLVVVRS